MSNAKEKECEPKKNMTQYCGGTQHNGDPCGNKVFEGKKFCKCSHDYMNDYTEEQLKSLKRCGGCHRERWSGEFKITKNGTPAKQCDACNTGNKKKRKKKKELDKEEKKPCKGKTDKGENCPYDVLISTGKNYCGIHWLDEYKAHVEELGLRVCSFYNRRCPEILDALYEDSACESCLQKGRISDTARREKKATDKKEKDTDTHKMCIQCGETYETEYFMVDGKLNARCDICRDYKRDYDNNKQRNDVNTDDHKCNEIRRRSRRKEIEITITDDEIKKLLQSNCCYCNYKKVKINKNGEEYHIMGVDRIDNNKGYIDGNVDSACGICNRCKWKFDQHDFIFFCINIYDYFGSKIEWDENEYVKSIPFRVHKNHCTKNNRTSDLTPKDVKKITSTKCYYCNGENLTDEIAKRYNLGINYNIGIDRMNSDIGYLKEKNKLVACCAICNIMKVDMTVEEFYNQILKILLHNGFIDKYTFDQKFIEIPKMPLVEYVNTRLANIYNYSEGGKKYRGNFHVFTKDSSHYIDMIWQGFTFHSFAPELEFCQSQKQIDTWMFYRLILCTYYPIENTESDILILIRDKFTKKYVAIVSLTELTTELFANINNNDNTDNTDNIIDVNKIKKNKIKHIFNITTCIGIPPFGFNYDGAKLATMLMFSKEVYDFMKQKGYTVAGLMAYSIHSNSVQYTNIDNFKIVGHANNEGDLDNINVPQKLSVLMKRVMLNKKYHIESDNLYNCKYYCAREGIINVSNPKHGIKQFVYFGTNGQNTVAFLTDGKEVEFIPDQRTVAEISDLWFTKYAMNRCNNLAKHNRIMIDYDYDNYYIDESGHKRHEDEKEIDPSEKDRKVKAICYWIEHFAESYEEINKKLKDNNILKDNETIKELIVQNNYDNLDAITKMELNMHIAFRHELIFDSKKIKFAANKEMYTVFLQKEREYFDNIFNNMKINIDKGKLYFTHQNFVNIYKCNRLFTKDDRKNNCVNNLKIGSWNIRSHDKYIKPKYALEMRHAEYNELPKNKETNTIIFSSDDIVFKIGLTQTDKEFHLNNLDEINGPIMIYGKGNIFVNIINYMTTNKLEVTTIKDKSCNNCIVDIKIRPMDCCEGTCEKLCFCNNYIEFLKKEQYQTYTYKSTYLNEITKHIRKNQENEQKMQKPDIYEEDNIICREYVDYDECAYEQAIDEQD
jgi:hypothetical protein